MQHANKVLNARNHQQQVQLNNILRGSTNIAQPANSSVSVYATQSMYINADHF